MKSLGSEMIDEGIRLDPQFYEMITLLYLTNRESFLGTLQNIIFDFRMNTYMIVKPLRKDKSFGESKADSDAEDDSPVIETKRETFQGTGSQIIPDDNLNVEKKIESFNEFKERNRRKKVLEAENRIYDDYLFYKTNIYKYAKKSASPYLNEIFPKISEFLDRRKQDNKFMKTEINIEKDLIFSFFNRASQSPQPVDIQPDERTHIKAEFKPINAQHNIQQQGIPQPQNNKLTLRTSDGKPPVKHTINTSGSSKGVWNNLGVSGGRRTNTNIDQTVTFVLRNNENVRDKRNIIG
jgi:hypothetical protein